MKEEGERRKGRKKERKEEIDNKLQLFPLGTLGTGALGVSSLPDSMSLNSFLGRSCDFLNMTSRNSSRWAPRTSPQMPLLSLKLGISTFIHPLIHRAYGKWISNAYYVRVTMRQQICQLIEAQQGRITK